MNETKFVRQPATIARVADHYYELRSAGVETMGCDTKYVLVRWARTHGFSVSFVDERIPALRAQLFDVGGAL